MRTDWELNCPGRMRIPGIRNLTKLQCGIRERFKGYGIWRQHLGMGCGIGKGKRYSGVAMTDEFRDAGFSRMKRITEAMIWVFPREINVLEIEGILGCWPVGYVDFTKVILRGCMKRKPNSWNVRHFLNRLFCRRYCLKANAERCFGDTSREHNVSLISLDNTE